MSSLYPKLANSSAERDRVLIYDWASVGPVLCSRPTTGSHRPATMRSGWHGLCDAQRQYPTALLPVFWHLHSFCILFPGVPWAFWRRSEYLVHGWTLTVLVEGEFMHHQRVTHTLGTWGSKWTELNTCLRVFVCGETDVSWTMSSCLLFSGSECQRLVHNLWNKFGNKKMARVEIPTYLLGKISHLLIWAANK